jgi:hypothetical protein
VLVFHVPTERTTWLCVPAQALGLWLEKARSPKRPLASGLTPTPSLLGAYAANGSAQIEC